MSLPNRHIAGQVVHLTRRTTQRQFLLVNDETGDVKNAMGYFYGLSILRNKQTAHAVCAMSNHYHLCQTDHSAGRSKAMQDFNHFVAKFINRFRKRRESMWSSSKPGDQV